MRLEWQAGEQYNLRFPDILNAGGCLMPTLALYSVVMAVSACSICALTVFCDEFDAEFVPNSVVRFAPKISLPLTSAIRLGRGNSTGIRISPFPGAR